MIKMKVRLYSDLHNEFHRNKVWVPPVLDGEDETVLVLAGDIDFLRYSLEYANSLSERFKAVVLVAGNHEYYNSNKGKLYEEQHYIEKVGGLKDNVYFLNGTSFEIDDVIFVGGTLWTHFGGLNERLMAQHFMNDFRYIRTGGRSGYRKFTTDDWSMEYGRHTSAIRNVLENKGDKKVIVVSHHAPSWKSQEFANENNETDHCYYSNLDKLVEKCDLWIHGHTHYCVDYMIGEGRVVSNARGYHRLISDDTYVAYGRADGNFDKNGKNIMIS